MSTETSETSAWILGAGGLLGQGLVRQAPSSGVTVFPGSVIPWDSPHERQALLREVAQEFSEFARGTQMVVVWAAGTTGVGSEQETAQAESDALQDLLAALQGVWPEEGCRFFLSSSAGAVYAESPHAPFSAMSPTRANSPYGQAKLWQEQFVQASLPPTVHLLIGRLGNLYGPSVNGRQGLINRLCSAALSRRAMNLFVPLDTLRDYCFVDDAAYLIWHELLLQRDQQRMSVIGSGRAVSISEVVSTVQQVAHRRVPIALGSDPESARQPMDLRLEPDWLRTFPEFQPLDLGTGIKRIINDLVIAPRL